MDKEIKVTGMRKIIAERMSESWQISPSVCYQSSVDMSNMTPFRKKLAEEVGRKISVNIIVAKACAKALIEYPYVNSSFTGDKIILHEEKNVGFAVAVPNGLLVPNIKNCNEKSFLEAANDFDRILECIKTNKLNMDDITGGTFTITNMGISEAVEYTTPIINQPEVAILGIYALKKMPVVINDEIVIRPMMNICLNGDHRVIDGKLAGDFIGRLKELLENPALI